MSERLTWLAETDASDFANDREDARWRTEVVRVHLSSQTAARDCVAPKCCRKPPASGHLRSVLRHSSQACFHLR